MGETLINTPWTYLVWSSKPRRIDTFFTQVCAFNIRIIVIQINSQLNYFQFIICIQ